MVCEWKNIWYDFFLFPFSSFYLYIYHSTHTAILSSFLCSTLLFLPQAPSQDHNARHSNPLTRRKNQLWGRHARSSFFESFHSLDKNVDPHMIPTSPRKDPFAVFTEETLEDLKATMSVPIPLTTTEYAALLRDHLTTMTKTEEEMEKRKRRSSSLMAESLDDPRKIFLRECRQRGMPPIPVLDYHRMSAKKFRFTENSGGKGASRYAKKM